MNTEKNYRIFRVEFPNGSIYPKKITMKRIYAKDNDDAYVQLKDYIKAANKEYKYYVEAWTPHIVIRNGKKHVCEDMFEDFEKERKEMPFFKRMYDDISLWLWRHFIDKPRNAYYWIRNTCYLLKNKQLYHASWCLDEVMLDTLKFNIPILKKYKQSLSWKMLNKAILEKNNNMTKDDLDEYHQTHCQGYSKDIEDRAIDLEAKMFDDLISDINAYNYYMGEYEYIDETDKDLVETDKKLRDTLPLIKGSYDRYDYKKLNSLIEKHWNRIWETMRTYGREFND